MLDYFYTWIKNIAYYMILVTALMHVIPNAGYQKYIRLFTGVTLILLLMSPILQMFGMNQELELDKRIAEYQEELEAIGNDTRYLEDVDVNDYLPEEETGEEQTKDGKIKIEKIEVGE